MSFQADKYYRYARIGMWFVSGAGEIWDRAEAMVLCSTNQGAGKRFDATAEVLGCGFWQVASSVGFVLHPVANRHKGLL